MNKFIYALVLIAGCILGSIQAPAGDAPMLVSSHDAWKSYYFLDNGGKVCFMSGQPKKQEGKFSKRGEVFFFVTHWSAEKDKNVVSVSNGYAFRPGSQLTVKVDGKSFGLFTQGEMAWTKNQEMDDAITSALQKGKTLVVKGVSKRGTETTDTYDLKGSSASYRDIAKTCANK